MNSSLAPVAMGFVALSLVLGAIEWRFPARTQKLFRRGYLTDVAYWLFTALVPRAVTRGAIVVAVVAVALASGSGASRDQGPSAVVGHRLRHLPLA